METPSFKENPESEEGTAIDQESGIPMLKERLEKLVREFANLLERKDKINIKLSALKDLQDSSIDSAEMAQEKLQKYIENVKSESAEILNQTISEVSKDISSKDFASDFTSILNLIGKVKSNDPEDLEIDISEDIFLSDVSKEEHESVIEDRIAALEFARQGITESIEKKAKQIDEIERFITSRKKVNSVADLLSIEDQAN